MTNHENFYKLFVFNMLRNSFRTFRFILGLLLKGTSRWGLGSLPRFKAERIDMAWCLESCRKGCSGGSPA